MRRLRRPSPMSTAWHTTRGAVANCHGSNACSELYVQRTKMPKSQAEKKRRAPAGGSRNAQPGGKKSWLERGQELLKDGDAKAAIACARSGLDELGDDYYVPGSEVEDDTGQKL